PLRISGCVHRVICHSSHLSKSGYSTSVILRAASQSWHAQDSHEYSELAASASSRLVTIARPDGDPKENNCSALVLSDASVSSTKLHSSAVSDNRLRGGRQFH